MDTHKEPESATQQLNKLISDRNRYRKALIELIRLYDWRFVLAEKEKQAVLPGQRKEVARLLVQYGMEKKAAWEEAKLAIADGDPTE